MSFLPAPLDNPLFLAIVIAGLIVMVIAMIKSRQATARLEAARADKARIIREAKLRSAQMDTAQVDSSQEGGLKH